MKKIKTFKIFINENYETEDKHEFTPTPEDFTFKTNAELIDAKRKNNYIHSYNIVRIEREMPNGSSIDYPCETYEDYEKEIKRNGKILNIYPADHMYEFEIYP